MLKSISDLKTLFEVMALVIVKSTSTFPAFYVMFYSFRAYIYTEQTNSSREATLKYYKGSALKAVNA